jgi:pimeloyl-ACP methyl ester carboxylesterase
VKPRAATIACAVVILAGCGGGEKAPPAALAGDLECTGSGAPAVILESGLGVEPTTWSGVVPAVSRVARVCVHERPGPGSSPPPGHSRTAAAVEAELERLLRAEHIDGPVVIAGASFGGYVAQLYASRRPRGVAGVVLVDSLHPDIDRVFARLFGKRAADARARQLAANSEGISFADLVRSAHQVDAAKGFPAVPLVVLQHGISFDPGGDPDPALERAWGRMQRELARRSPQGRLIVAERSHHRIAEDQPALVARAIDGVVAAP